MARCDGFRLTKFMSNDQEVLKALPLVDISPKRNIDLDTEHMERMGVIWDTVSDMLTFTFSPKESPQTKRGILRTVASLFDPLGFVSPFILKAKILLQDTWRQGLEWDEEVNVEVAECWANWLVATRNVATIKLDRCYVRSNSAISTIQLHLFSDASEMAYGSVAYLRFTLKDGQKLCKLVMSKSKLAPIKVVTLPRLELNGAVSAVRLCRLIVQEVDLPIENIYFWTDSMLVLQYVKNRTHRFKTYVANRVTEILDSSHPDQWSHIAGIANPADLLTRGVSDPKILLEVNKNQTSWFEGPAFLKTDEEAWPEMQIKDLKHEDMEIKRISFLIALSMMGLF